MYIHNIWNAGKHVLFFDLSDNWLIDLFDCLVIYTFICTVFKVYL